MSPHVLYTTKSKVGVGPFPPSFPARNPIQPFFFFFFENILPALTLLARFWPFSSLPTSSSSSSSSPLPHPLPLLLRTTTTIPHRRAPWLPWVLLGMGILLHHNPLADLLGIAAGHVYYFLEDVYPRPRSQGGLGGPRVLTTPAIIAGLFAQPDDDIPAPPAAEMAGGMAWDDPDGAGIHDGPEAAAAAAAAAVGN